MVGRASIVAAAETSVGKVRDHNEDAHFIDNDLGIFLVCDGMGGHAAGEVASAMAVEVIHETWGGQDTQGAAERWLSSGTPDARKALLGAVTEGVVAAHGALLAEAERDRTKGGMGTTLVGAMSVGGDIVFAHCGDSRAYLVRDGIAMQLTEDHTLLARLLAAGVDVDTSAEGARFKSMLTNALGIGQECKVSTFIVPVADGDRFLLCSDGITEYVSEPEIGEVLCKQPSPAKAAAKLVELALERGGADNATALVVRVLEAGETSRPSELLRKESEAIEACPLWAKITPQQRLRALRIALPRDHVLNDRIPALTLGDRVAWIIVEGHALQEGLIRGPGSLLYPEALLADRPLPDKEGLAVATEEVRLLALRSDDFRELCEDDPDLGEALLDALGLELSSRRSGRRTQQIPIESDIDAHGTTEPGTKRDPVTGELARAPTPPSGLEKVEQHVAVTPRRGSIVPAREITPVKGSPIVPRVPMPVHRPSPPKLSPGPLFFKPADRAATESAVDRALSNIELDAVPVATDDDEPSPTPEAAEDEPGQVIEVEAEPADPPPRRPSQPAPRQIGASEPEISILALEAEIEMEADEPPEAEVTGPVQRLAPPPARDEPSEPEIVVIKPGRAVTAGDTPLVAGTIEPPKRARRGTED